MSKYFSKNIPHSIPSHIHDSRINMSCSYRLKKSDDNIFQYPFSLSWIYFRLIFNRILFFLSEHPFLCDNKLLLVRQIHWTNVIQCWHEIQIVAHTFWLLMGWNCFRKRTQNVIKFSLRRKNSSRTDSF